MELCELHFKAVKVNLSSVPPWSDTFSSEVGCFHLLGREAEKCVLEEAALEAAVLT